MKLSTTLAALSAVALMALQGCAVGIRHDPIPEVNRLDLREPNLANLKVQVTVKAGNSKASRRETPEKAQKKIEDLLRDANMAVPISTAADADVIVDADLYEEASPAGTVITLLSLGTIPAWTNTDLRLEARVWRRTASHDYMLRESYTNIVWWPLILAAPFKPYVAQDDVQDNMYRTLVLKMKNDGIFK